MTYEDPTPVSSIRPPFWLLAGTLLVWGLYDLWAFTMGEPGDTISEASLWLAQQHPFVIIIPSILVGHFFWPQRVPR